MTVDSFLICLREFYFLTQSDDFAKAIAFSWRPFLVILKLSYFRVLGVFRSGFLHRITILWLYRRF